jgi:hypothetical protein
MKSKASAKLSAPLCRRAKTLNHGSCGSSSGSQAPSREEQTSRDSAHHGGSGQLHGKRLAPTKIAFRKLIRSLASAWSSKASRVLGMEASQSRQPKSMLTVFTRTSKTVFSAALVVADTARTARTIYSQFLCSKRDQKAGYYLAPGSTGRICAGRRHPCHLQGK